MDNGMLSLEKSLFHIHRVLHREARPLDSFRNPENETPLSSKSETDLSQKLGWVNRKEMNCLVHLTQPRGPNVQLPLLSFNVSLSTDSRQGAYLGKEI